MRAALAAFAVLALVNSAHAEESLPGPIEATLIEVIDGDTVRVRAHIWLGQEMETLVRLDGIDAPELAGRCERERILARQARDRLSAELAGGPVRLWNVRPDKYWGRVVAAVMDPAGRDPGEALVEAGLARPYDGGKRAGWCPGP